LLLLLLLLAALPGGQSGPSLVACNGSVSQKWEFGTGLWDGFLVSGNTWWGTTPTASAALAEQQQQQQQRQRRRWRWQQPEQRQCTASLQAGANCDGADLKDIGPASVAACCQACAALTNCTAFTVNGAEASPARHCFLKKNCASVKVAPPDTTSGNLGGPFVPIDATVLSAAACGMQLGMAAVGSMTANSTTCCGAHNANSMRFRLSNASDTGQGLLTLNGGCGQLLAGYAYCVEATGVGHRAVVLTKCNASNPAQRWYFDPYGGTGVFGARGYLVHTATRLCLDGRTRDDG
jgi:hypothetical protein